MNLWSVSHGQANTKGWGNGVDGYNVTVMNVIYVQQHLYTPVYV